MKTLCVFGGNFIPVISMWSEIKWHFLNSFPSFGSYCIFECFTCMCSCRRALICEEGLLQYNLMNMRAVLKAV